MWHLYPGDQHGFRALTAAKQVGFWKTEKQSEIAWLLVCLAVCAAMTWMAGCASAPASQPVSFPSTYQAVLLGNNSVYFGKLSGYGTPNPVLTDVFYIVTQADPETKQTKNILVKRGKELHGPDRMYLNPGQIVFVEPVGADSKVAQLIAEANK